MTRPSSIDRLPDQLREAIAAAFEHGATLDEIISKLDFAGNPVSRSALGRYRQRWEALRRRMAATREAAKILSADLESVATDGQGRLLVELIQTIILQAADGEAPEPKDAAMLARALRDLAGAKDKLLDLETRLRREITQKTAKDVELEVLKKGLPKDLATQIRQAIEGNHGG